MRAQNAPIHVRTNSPTKKINKAEKAQQNTDSKKDIFDTIDNEQMLQGNDTPKMKFEDPKLVIPTQNVDKVKFENPKVDSDQRAQSTKRKVDMNDEFQGSKSKLENRPEDLRKNQSGSKKNL